MSHTTLGRRGAARSALFVAALALVAGPAVAISASASNAVPAAVATQSASGASANGASPGGKFLGVVPSRPRVAAASAKSTAHAAVTPVTYHGGPVQHSSAVYAIFWVPTGSSLPDGYEATVSQFFTDVAHDSYLASNEYGSATQYYDVTKGVKKWVSYNVAFKTAIVDTRALPKSGCANYVIGDGSKSLACLTDAQIEKEISSAISSHNLPTGIGNEYFLFTPQGVASCMKVGSLPKNGCYNPLTLNGYCAYHSHFGSGAHAVLYANMPYDAIAGCTSGQSPNGNAADAVLNNVTHEQNETITDPLGTAWYDAAGNEIADKCHLTFGSALGSTATGQFNEVINGHGYWLQQVWSNRAHACVQRNTFPQPTAAFSFKPAVPAPGKKVTFTSSVHEAGATGLTYHWTFPDGGVSSAKNPTHLFATTVIFGNVTLIVSDPHGDQTRTVNTITVVK